jgi:uncharacterized caspase-like protein
MTKTLGLILSLGVLAVAGVVAAQNLIPSTQNAAPPPGPAPVAGPAPGGPAPGVSGEKRIALVVGNSGYQAGELKTAANDAGLMAQTLQAAGFDVAGARDLDQESLRHALRDFLDKAQSSGPDTVAFVYLAGYGVQFEGENYFVPIDAKLAHAADVPVEAVRMSDYTRPLAGMGLKANIIVLDAGRANPFAKSGPPLAGGLALVDADPGMLIALNAAPGTVAPDGDGPYGAYAQALAEMIRDGGLQLSDVFDRVRLRVNEMTKGAEVPWQSANIKAPFEFFERAADAPPPAVAPQQVAEMRSRPIRDIGPQDAYAAALERDTLDGYQDFIAAYPGDPMAGRVRAIIAARREALTWRRTRIVDTPEAYWSYLRRYPRGPHVADAQRRLADIQAALAPPPTFATLAYDIPPPPPDEIVYVDRPVLYFSDPVFAFAPPPPPPVIFLAPPPPFWVVLPPPPPPIGLFVLPIPVYQPVPVWVRPPAYIAPPPPNNIIYNNVHNTVIVNNVTNNVTIRNAAGQTTTQPIAVAAHVQGGPPGAPGAAPASVGPSLPPSVATRAAAFHGAATQASSAPGAPGAPGTPGASGAPGQHQFGQPLPGAPGQHPLPQTPGGAATAALPGSQPGPHSLTQPGTAALPGGQAPGHGQPPAPGTAPTASLPGGQHALPVPGEHGQPPAPGAAPSAGLPAGHGLPPVGGAPPSASLPGASHPLDHAAPGAAGHALATPPGTPPPGQGLHAPPGGPHAPGAGPPSAAVAPSPAPQVHTPPSGLPLQHTAPPAPPHPTPSAPSPLANIAPHAPPAPPAIHAPGPPPAAARPAPPPQMRAAAPPPPRPAAPPPARPAPPAAKPAGKPACGGPGQPKCPK